MDSMEKACTRHPPTHKVCIYDHICMHHVTVDDGDGDSKADGESAGS